MKYKVTLFVILALAAGLYLWNDSRHFNDQAMAGIPDYTGMDATSVLAGEDIKSLLEPSYFKYVDRMDREHAAKNAAEFELVIPAAQYAAVSLSGYELLGGLGEAEHDALALTETDSWVEYRFVVPQDGYYQMGMTYYALPGKRSSIVRSVQVDGVYPFFQAKKLEFQRMWQEAGPSWYDNQDNEFNPRREEVLGWQYRAFQDAENKVSEPLRIYLSKGEHTIRITNVREPAAIGELRIHAPTARPTYAQIRQRYANAGYEETNGQYIKVQAEASTLRSDPTLKRIEDREPDTDPLNSRSVTLNSFGGLGWRNGGQWAQWEFEVPESGLYHIGARFGQWFLNGIPVQRKLTIDGEVPFQEADAITFPYKPEWQINRFGDEAGEFLFYLEQGKHTLRLETQVSGLGGIMEQITDTTHNMSLLTREVVRVTGTNPDPNGDWKLERNIPNLVARLHLMAKELDDAVNAMYVFGVEQGSSEVSTLLEARDVLLSMADETRSIPSRLVKFTELQSALGLWVSNLQKQSLVLDYFIVKSPDRSWPRPAAPWYVRAGTSARDFFYSFLKDYSGVGNVYADGEEQVLEVWIARGRDWVEIIKQMIDEDFTPETGIKVNVNVIPANQSQVLLLSTTSGLSPDVALGVDGEVPIDFAVRGGLLNLNQFPDYAQVADRFKSGALIPFKYNGGDYALPENQNFYMLFYRKDILQQLGLTDEDIPNTWEEVMDLIPLLQQNGLDFYYPHAHLNPSLAINEFSPFLFQMGGELYRDNGRLSDLDSPEAIEAMKMWTGLFTNYRIQRQADFYNRFRAGEMPIGIADYSTYILLSTAAPELAGWWGMKPLPGILQEDGRINRSTGGLAQTGVIFHDTDMPEESWAFLKWWTSADAQERFGSELEALLGVEARWNTANVEALERLPWHEEDIAAILEQWNWFKEREVVLGGYYTTRHLFNMWNEIVLSGKLPREAVETGVKEINKELRKKREEFGLDDTAKAGRQGGGQE